MVAFTTFNTLIAAASSQFATSILSKLLDLVESFDEQTQTTLILATEHIPTDTLSVSESYRVLVKLLDRDFSKSIRSSMLYVIAKICVKAPVLVK